MSFLARLLRSLGRRSRLAPGPSPGRGPADPHPPADETASVPEMVELEIGPEIDLHSFSPRETRDVVDTYLREAHARGLREVRVVHGRGRGVQRNIVRSLLSRHPLVESYRDAHPGSGGWGATIVVLLGGGEEGGRP